MSYLWFSRNKRLSATQMREALASLQEIHTRYMGQLTPPEREHLSKWSDQQLLPTTSVYVMESQRPALVHHDVFRDTVVSDYFLHLSYVFYALNASDPSWVAALANNLTEGLSQDGPDVELNIIPEVYQTRMPTQAMRYGRWNGPIKHPLWVLWHWLRYMRRPMTLAGFLASNKMLMVLLLLRMIISPRQQQDLASLSPTTGSIATPNS